MASSTFEYDIEQLRRAYAAHQQRPSQGSAGGRPMVYVKPSDELASLWRDTGGRMASAAVGNVRRDAGLAMDAGRAAITPVVENVQRDIGIARDAAGAVAGQYANAFRRDVGLAMDAGGAMASGAEAIDKWLSGAGGAGAVATNIAKYTPAGMALRAGTWPIRTIAGASGEISKGFQEGGLVGALDATTTALGRGISDDIIDPTQKFLFGSGVKSAAVPPKTGATPSPATESEGDALGIPTGGPLAGTGSPIGTSAQTIDSLRSKYMDWLGQSGGRVSISAKMPDGRQVERREANAHDIGNLMEFRKTLTNPDDQTRMDGVIQKRMALNTAEQIRSLLASKGPEAAKAKAESIVANPESAIDKPTAGMIDRMAEDAAIREVFHESGIGPAAAQRRRMAMQALARPTGRNSAGLKAWRGLQADMTAAYEKHKATILEQYKEDVKDNANRASIHAAEAQVAGERYKYERDAEDRLETSKNFALAERYKSDTALIINESQKEQQYYEQLRRAQDSGDAEAGQKIRERQQKAMDAVLGVVGDPETLGQLQAALKDSGKLLHFNLVASAIASSPELAGKARQKAIQNLLKQFADPTWYSAFEKSDYYKRIKV